MMRFHWSMSSAGEKLRGAQARAAVGIPTLDTLVRFCRHAEECEIESLLTAFGFHRLDAITLAAALGVLTTKIKFMVAVRSGIMSPTLFVQQVNSVAQLTNGRICLNVVAGHTPEEQRYYGDFLTHDERYERTDEFLSVCHSFWRRDGEVNFEGRHYRIEKGKLNIPFVAPDRATPEIFLGGSSEKAEQLAIKHADCLWRLPDTPEKLRAFVKSLEDRQSCLSSPGSPGQARLPVPHLEVGLLVSVIIRDTHDEAVRAAAAILDEVGQRPKRTHEDFKQRSDSVAFTSTYELAAKNDWLTPYLWAGAVPYLGAPAMAIVGSPDEVANALFEFRAAGITQFLFMGWPDMEEMTNFHRDVLPLVRARELAEQQQVVAEATA